MKTKTHSSYICFWKFKDSRFWFWTKRYIISTTGGCCRLSMTKVMTWYLEEQKITWSSWTSNLRYGWKFHCILSKMKWCPTLKSSRNLNVGGVRVIYLPYNRDGFVLSGCRWVKSGAGDGASSHCSEQEHCPWGCLCHGSRRNPYG